MSQSLGMYDLLASTNQSSRTSSDSLWGPEQRFSWFSRLQLPNISITVFEVSWFMIISVLLLPRPHQTVFKLEHDIQGNLNLCLSIFGCRDFFSLSKNYVILFIFL